MPLTVQPGAPLPGIEHIVVLMFENRSFDNVLGNLYPNSPAFDGIPDGAFNRYRTLDGEHIVRPGNTPPSGKSIYVTPNPDPAESHKDMVLQIYDGGSVATMGGFAQSYHNAHPFAGSPGDVMCYFDSNAGDGAGQLPVTAFMARNFAVSDRWFGSGPVQTFPNRMFAFCAMPGEFHELLHESVKTAPINNTDYVLHGSGYVRVLGSVTQTTVFELLDRAANSSTPDPANWKVYFHDVSLSAISSYVYAALEAGSPCVSNFDTSDYNPPHGGNTFADDVRNGTLPAFAWIEPRYWGNYSQSGEPANSNHPGNDNYLDFGLTGQPIDCAHGETLLATVLNTLNANPEVFNRTLLVVIYDEHGGVWDHVPPAAAPIPYGPGSGVVNAEVYSTTGPRVPAMFANPMIPAGTVLRPSGGPAFDHTSLIATLTAQFGLAGPLTARDAAAPLLDNLIPPAATPRPPSECALPASLTDGLPRAEGGTPGPRKSMDEHDQVVRGWALGHTK
jgi:phospholipase C